MLSYFKAKGFQKSESCEPATIVTVKIDQYRVKFEQDSIEQNVPVEWVMLPEERIYDLPVGTRVQVSMGDGHIPGRVRVHGFTGQMKKHYSYGIEYEDDPGKLYGVSGSLLKKFDEDT